MTVAQNTVKQFIVSCMSVVSGCCVVRQRPVRTERRMIACSLCLSAAVVKLVYGYMFQGQAQSSHNFGSGQEDFGVKNKFWGQLCISSITAVKWCLLDSFGGGAKHKFGGTAPSLAPWLCLVYRCACVCMCLCAQVAVLLQYNHKTSFTIQELQENTQMTVADLQQVLRTLLKIRLLFCDYTTSSSLSSSAAAESEASVTEKDSELLLPLDAVCHLYQDYKNRKTRVNINVPLRSVEKRELEATHKSVDDERRYLIEAAIIRVMKTKQKLAHQDLVGRVMGQLAARFVADCRTIKKCIDDLISRDYMKRCDNSPSTYQYVA